VFFFWVGLDDEAELATNKLKIDNLKLKIDFHPGPHLDENSDPVTEVDRKLESDVVNRINSFKPQLLFVAFG